MPGTGRIDEEMSSLRISEIDSLTLVRGYRNLGRFATEFFLYSFDRVSAGGHALQRKGPILTRHREKRVAHYGKKSSHPWMHTTGHRKPDFLARERFKFFIGLGRLRFIPRDIDLRLGVNVVIHGVRVIDFELLSYHKREGMRAVDATVLVENHAGLRRSPTSLGQSLFDPYKCVADRTVEVKDDGLGMLRGRVLALAHGIGRHVDGGHSRFVAGENDLAGDCGPVGFINRGDGEYGFGVYPGWRMAATRTHHERRGEE